MILCLDIGTKCGWAVAASDAPYLPPPSPLFGNEAAAIDALRHYDYGLWNGTGPERGRFYLRFTKWLTGQIKDFDVELLAFEANPAVEVGAVAGTSTYTPLQRPGPPTPVAGVGAEASSAAEITVHVCIATLATSPGMKTSPVQRAGPGL